MNRPSVYIFFQQYFFAIYAREFCVVMVWYILIGIGFGIHSIIPNLTNYLCCLCIQFGQIRREKYEKKKLESTFAFGV